MKATDVYLAGMGVFQPSTVDAGQAARRGEYDPLTYRDNRLTGVCVAGDVSAPEMAVRAGRQALTRAGVDPARIGLLLHASIFLQGPLMWYPPVYIQKHLAGNSVPAFEVRLGCNGVFAALELAACRMATLAEHETVLVTTAENVGSPLVDRWRSVPGMLLGDAGGALLLCRGSGFARLLAVGTASVPEAEQLYRGGEPLYPPPGLSCGRVDIGERAAYFRDHVMPLAEVTEAQVRAQRDVTERTLTEAGRKLDDMTRVIYANMAGYLTQLHLEPLGIPLERTTWQFGRGVGHTGASDHLLSLNHLLVTGQLAAGDHVLLAGAGAGSVSGAVLEILDIPDWARA